MSDVHDRIDVDAIGGFVADAFTPEPGARLPARQRLIAATTHGTTRRPTWPWAVGGMLAAGMILGVIAWRWPSTPSPTIAGGGIAEVATDSTFVQAPAHGSAALPVGAGADLQLDDGGRGRVSLADHERVAVVLEAGRLRADVDPQAHRRVTIEAGPYRVGVIGTVFQVDWDPAVGRLVVGVTRGKVEVSVPHASAPIAVDAGRRLVAEDDGDVQLAALAAAVDVPAPVDDAVVEIEAEVPTPLERARPRARSKSDDPAPSWQALARAGRYAEALAQVEGRGLEAALASLPVADLEQLADAARLAGRGSIAATIYERVRKRFPGTKAAARAAFQLGRWAADGEKDPKAATTWLRRYLDEAPNGSFAKLARGRLIQTLAAAGDRAAAREAARIYLDSYPDGPHAAVARGLVESP